MKKIIIIALVLTVVPMMAFAAAGDWPSDITRSNGVLGSYYVNANPATEYSLSTGHTQGNRVYFSGSNDSKIYAIILADSVVLSSDNLLKAHEPAFSSDSTKYGSGM
jgi:hypothetical protein